MEFWNSHTRCPLTYNVGLLPHLQCTSHSKTIRMVYRQPNTKLLSNSPLWRPLSLRLPLGTSFESNVLQRLSIICRWAYRRPKLEWDSPPLPYWQHLREIPGWTKLRRQPNAFNENVTWVYPSFRVQALPPVLGSVMLNTSHSITTCLKISIETYVYSLDPCPPCRWMTHSVAGASGLR